MDLKVLVDKHGTFVCGWVPGAGRLKGCLTDFGGLVFQSLVLQLSACWNRQRWWWQRAWTRKRNPPEQSKL